MFSGIDRVNSTLLNCTSTAENTLKQNPGRKICGKPERANPPLDPTGPSPLGKPQNLSPKPAYKWTPEPTDISDPLFDQGFDQFMESLDNLEPYDDLEDLSDNVDLFMDAMSHTPHMADILWEPVKLKKNKGTSKTPEKSSESIFDKPWTKEPEGLTPTQSWLYWMNENALRVDVGITLLAHPKHAYSKIGGLTDFDFE